MSLTEPEMEDLEEDIDGGFCFPSLDGAKEHAGQLVKRVTAVDCYACVDDVINLLFFKAVGVQLLK